jgi:nucleoside-diphosphate-sugar epimerase
MSNPQRILITGAGGQIGSELIDALQNRFGADNVIASDIHQIDMDTHNNGASYLLDVTNETRLRQIAVKERIDMVVHLAALLSWDSEKVPDNAWEINVVGTLNVLKTARDLHLHQVFLPSSIAVFGPDTPKDKTPTDTVLRPATIYGVTKVTGELLGKYFVTKWGVDVRGVRYPGIISAGTPPSGGTTDWAVEMFIAAINKRPYTCFVKKETRLPMMYMPDCIKATLELMTAPFEHLRHHTDFNISGMAFSAGELEASIRRHIPGFKCRYRPDERQAIADSWPRSLNDTAAREEWGWRPAYDLEAMTTDMIEKLNAEQLLQNPQS